MRAEVKEQILSLGAKFIELDVGEEGSGSGGYAKELSEAAKNRQQALLGERLKKADIIISTANIPGRKSAGPHHGRCGQRGCAKVLS